MRAATLLDDPSEESFFNIAETETLALYYPFTFEFLEEFDMLAPTTSWIP